MALDKTLKIYDEQGNEVDYDILAKDVKFLHDGKDLPTKLAELEDEIGEGGYAPPVGGIPKTDLAPDVQTSLGKADTALQSADKNELQSAINSLQSALNTLIGSGNVQGAIDTFNEVVAFLNGIDTDDQTLFNQLKSLSDAITALQTSLAGKISGIKTSDNTPLTPDSNGIVTLPPAGSTISPATAAPTMDGTAGVGSSEKYAREDHVHPHDTSKQDTITDLATIRTGASAGATALQPSDVTVDSIITRNSTNPVQGGAIYSALAGKAGTIYYEDVDEMDADVTQDSGTLAFVDDGSGFHIWSSSEMVWFKVVTPNDLDSYVPTTRTVNGKALSSDITLNASDVGAQSTITDIETIRTGASAGATALQPSDVSVETPATPDGTFELNVGNDTYTVNINHTHEGMAKLVVCDESDLPSTLEEDTIYGVEEDGEISVLYVGGIPFYGGGGGGASTPVLRQPTDGSTIDVGKIESGESSVTKTITVKGKNLTQALTVAVTGTGYSANKQTISAADANAGTTLTITCTSTADNAAGTLSLASSEVSCDCDLVANVATYEDLRGVKLTGSQWMQTDYKPNPNTEFVMTAKFTANANTQNPDAKGQYIFNCPNDGNKRWVLYNGATNDSPYIMLFNNEQTIGNQIIKFGTSTNEVVHDPVTISYAKATSKGVFTFNGGTARTVDTVLKTTTMAQPMSIGYHYGASLIYNTFDLTIYSIIITENGNEVRHWVPKTRNGIAGLYDTVNGTFISSETSTELVAVPLT